MSKNVYFMNISTSAVETVNEVLDINFAWACESLNLSASKKEAQKNLETIRAAADLGEATREQVLAAQNAINIIDMKRKAINSWKKSMLMDSKDENKNINHGLYHAMGITADLIDKWAECRNSGTWGKWNQAIRAMLADVYEMDIKNDKLVARFASQLEHAIGNTSGSISDIAKGVLLKDKSSVAKFAEVFASTMATYMAKTCQSIVIPSKELFNGSIQYDKNWKVIGCKVTPVTEEESATENQGE